MNKLTLLLVAGVAVFSMSGALLVARDSHRVKRVAAFRATNLPVATVATPSNQSQGAPMNTSQSSSSNVSVSNNSSSTSQSSSTSAVTITVSSDTIRSQNLNFSRGTDVTLTIEVTGSNGLKFVSSNAKLNFGTISPGASASASFQADSSFTIQPYLLDGAIHGPAINVTVN